MYVGNPLRPRKLAKDKIEETLQRTPKPPHIVTKKRSKSLKFCT